MMNIKSFYQNRRVLVTGGAGFVGSNIVHSLLKSGAEVTVLDNFHKDYGSNLFNLEFESHLPKVNLVRGDITDRALMEGLSLNSEIIFHAAAQCSHVDSMIDPWLDLKFNNEGTLVLLEASKAAAKQTGKAPRIVYISTRAVVGAPLESPATERVLPNPTDVYGVNKLAAEYYGAVYARVHKIPFLSLRMTNSFGPRHQMKSGKYGILNWFLSLALQGKPIKIFGTGQQLRDYLFIDDAVDAVLKSALFLDGVSLEPTRHTGRHRLCGDEIPYSVFNLASGKPLPFVDCAKKIVEKVSGASLELVPWPADRKAIETGDYIADSSEAQLCFDWKPQTTFEAGLDKTIEFYREHLRKYL